MRTAIEIKPDEAGVFGYGSLLLLSSMERTLGRSYGGCRHVCTIQGWRRRWTSLYPNEDYYFLKPDGHRCYPKNITYLNIEPDTGHLNGLVYVIKRSDLEVFDRREAIYDRIEVPRHFIGAEIIGGSVYVYVGKSQYVMTAPLPVEEAVIRASYIGMIEDALAELGPEFRKEYDRSSDKIPIGSVVNDAHD